MSEKIVKDQNKIETIINELGDLPSPPLILTKALKIVSDLQSNLPHLVRTLYADQALSAKVIKMSNSPMYSRLHEVTTLDDAIKTLGYSQLKSIITTATTFKMFEDCAHADIATDLWHHSLSSAIASRLIANIFDQLDNEEAYLSGLLHDIGKLVLLKLKPFIYEKVIKTVKSSNVSFLQAETDEFGFNHQNIAQLLLTKWEFPPQTTAAIANHHGRELNEKSSIYELGRVIALANHISRYNGVSFYEPYINDLTDFTFVGPKALNQEDIISLRLETESLLYEELNHFYYQN